MFALPALFTDFAPPDPASAPAGGRQSLPSLLSLHRADQLIGYDRVVCQRAAVGCTGSLHHRLGVSVADRLQLAGQRGQLGVIVPPLHLPRQSALLAAFQHTSTDAESTNFSDSDSGLITPTPPPTPTPLRLHPLRRYFVPNRALM